MDRLISENKNIILDEKTENLIAIGAATASNCIPCFEHLYEKAITCGLTLEQIKRASDIAGQVKNGAHTALLNSVYELTGYNANFSAPCVQSEKKSCCS